MVQTTALRYIRMQAEKHHISLARNQSQANRSRNNSHGVAATGAESGGGARAIAMWAAQEKDGGDTREIPVNATLLSVVGQWQ